MHDPGADVGPADIDGENRVMRLKHPRRSQLHRANQARLIGIVANNADFGFDVIELQQHGSPADRQFADPAADKTSADHDPRSVLPALELEKLPQHHGQLLRKQFDGALHNASGLGIAAGEQGIKPLLGDLARRLVAKRILADVAHRLAPGVDEFPKRAFAGAIADEAFVVFQLDVVACDRHGRQPLGAMRQGDGRCCRLFWHPTLTRRKEKGSSRRGAGNPWISRRIGQRHSALPTVKLRSASMRS